ncbi:MAG: tetratricopeptide repeat protein [Steroidobacteraceae bacterium]
MFSNSLVARLSLVVGIIASSACASANRSAAPAAAPESFYTVTAELALARHEPRVAALQYATAAQSNPALWPRAVEVATEGLQPSLGLSAAEHWIRADLSSLEAQRAAGSAALALHKVAVAAAHYRIVVTNTPGGSSEAFTQLEKELRGAENTYGAREVADRLAKLLPASPALLRLQGFTALRADDPAAAAREFAAVIAQGEPASPHRADAGAPNGELTQAWRRARVLSGEVDAPLAEALAQVKRDATPESRFDYGLLLWTAKRDALARTELQALLAVPEARADALRVLGLLEYQLGDDTAASARFTELLATGAYVDEGFYYLGLIAERRGDLERALRAYARVQSGEDLVPALLRAASILHTHGAEQQADELLDRLGNEEPAHITEILAASAEIYTKSADPQRALALLQRARMDYPDSVELRYALATQFEQQGQLTAALKELQALLDARPDDPAAQNALGYTLADHARELRRARALIEHAYAAAPHSAAIRDSLGWVLYRQGRAQQALPLLSGAFADEPGGDIGAHLGEVLWQLDQRAEAEKIWTEARRIDADNHLVQSTRARLHEQTRADH